MKNITTFLTITLVMLTIITQGVVIYISNTSAADSIHATKLSAKIDKITEENINLESKILTFASYQAIASRAADLGYANSRDFVSVYDPVKVALGR